MFAVTNVSGINAAQIGVVLTFTGEFVDVVHLLTGVTSWAVILGPSFALITTATADFGVRLPSSYSNDDLIVLEAQYELHRKG